MKVNGFQIYNRNGEKKIEIEFTDVCNATIEKVENSFFTGEGLYILTAKEIDKLCENRLLKNVKSDTNEIKCDKMKSKSKVFKDILRGKKFES